MVLSKNPSTPLKPITREIVNGTTDVDAGENFDYPFTIPANSSSIHVSGNFSVEGGSGSGVIIYIFDITNYENYENGSYFGALYQSSQARTDLISSNLDASGDYFLVIDNTLSSIAQTVYLQANVTYFTH